MKKYLFIFILCLTVIHCLCGCEDVPNLSDMPGNEPIVATIS